MVAQGAENIVLLLIIFQKGIRWKNYQLISKSKPVFIAQHAFIFLLLPNAAIRFQYFIMIFQTPVTAAFAWINNKTSKRYINEKYCFY
jgi:hypothetical protein